MRVAVIGGSGMEELLRSEAEWASRLVTPYGEVELAYLLVDDHQVVFLPRHGFNRSNPPHKVNYQGLIYVIKAWGAKYVIATNSVGSLREEIKPGDVFLPDQFIDFTKFRPSTMSTSGIKHVDTSRPYSDRVRRELKLASERQGFRVHLGGVYVCSEGPRFETPAEIKAFRILGGHVVGMTGATEASLANEAGLEYASLCLVTNYAAGLQARVSQDEVLGLTSKLTIRLKNVVVDAIKRLSE